MPIDFQPKEAAEIDFQPIDFQGDDSPARFSPPASPIAPGQSIERIYGDTAQLQTDEMPTGRPAAHPALRYGPTLQQLHQPISIPGVPRPIPYELQSDEQQTAEAPRFINPRTGRSSPRRAPGQEPGLARLLDMPITGGQQMVQGVEQMAEPELREKAGGASKVLRGAMEAATPLIPAELAAAPAVAIPTLITGIGLQAGAEKGLDALGVPPEYAALASDVIAIGAAGATYAKLKAFSRLPSMREGNAIAGKLEQVVTAAKDPNASPMARAASRAQAEALLDGLDKAEAAQPSAAVVAERPQEVTPDRPQSIEQPTPETTPAESSPHSIVDLEGRTKGGNDITPTPEITPNVRAGEMDNAQYRLSGLSKGREGVSLEHVSDNPKERGRTLVYRDADGAPKGYLHFYLNDERTAVAPKDHGALPEVYVAPEARRSGIATQLYDTADRLGYDLSQISGTETTPDGAAFLNARRQSTEVPTTGEAEAYRDLNPTTGHPAARFMKDESGTSRITQMLQKDVAETKALAAKRQAMMDELAGNAVTPQEKQSGQKIKEFFTGERDQWGARINQVISQLRRDVPDYVDQEALSLMRDFKNKPGELQAWRDGTHPVLQGMIADAQKLAGAGGDAFDAAELRAKTALENIEKLQPAIDKALNPTPAMLSADRVLDVMADVSLREGQKRGFLESSLSPDEYVTHLLHPKDDISTSVPMSERMGRAIGGKIGRNFAQAQKRNYPTLLDAVADNVKPRTLNALDAFTIYGDKFATVRATHMLIDVLKQSDVGKWGFKGAENIPDGWREIAPHAHLFQNNVSYMDAEGNPTSARQTLMVPPKIEEALRPITDPDYTNKIAGFSKTRVGQAFIKAANLSLSVFHAKAENLMALANMGAKGWYKGLEADRYSPEFNEMERDMIAHGGTSSIQGKTFEAYKALQPGSIPTWGDIMRRAPGIHEMDLAAQKITDFTFGKLQRQFKVTDYAIKKAAWLGKNPNATPLEQTAAMQSIAKEVNAVYGGLHTENLGINRTSWEVARSVMLAPDWTFSNIFNVKYAMERGKTPAGQAARAFWVRAMVGGLAATQGMSLLLSGKPSSRPTMVYMGNDKEGKEIYQNMFFSGAPGDAVNLVANVKDYGAVQGLAKTMMGKAAPVLRTGIQTGTNRNYLNQELVPKGSGPVKGTALGAWGLAQGLAPIPFSAVNIWNMLAGPQADTYKMPEVFSTLLSGTPTRHVRPGGETKLGRAINDYEQTFNSGRDVSERDHIKRQITQQYRMGNAEQGQTLSAKALQEGKVTEKDVEHAMNRAAVDPLLADFKRLPLDQMVKMLPLANPTERQKVLPMFFAEMKTLDTYSPVEQKQIMEQIQSMNLFGHPAARAGR